MRIVVGSLQQESNSLTVRKSDIGDFEVHRGPKMMDHISVGSFFENAGFEVVPTLYAHALPGGVLTNAAFEELSTGLVSMIPTKEIDGIWLYLHGALEVDGVGSGELSLLRDIRERVGQAIPIALALDFHANNTEELMALVNIVVGYRTVPHRDMRETEQFAAQLLVQCIREKILPHPQMTRCPVVAPGDAVLSDCEPLRSIMSLADDLQRQPGMLVCNVFNGQPWVDAPHMGPSMVCIHSSDPNRAKAASLRLAKTFFASRDQFRFAVEAMEPNEALSAAHNSAVRPVFVSDSGDNTTAGASGDNASILQMVLTGGIGDALIAGITDARVVRTCQAMNTGDVVDCTIGATIEPESTSVGFRGQIKYSGRIEGWYGEDAGLAVVLNNGSVDVVVTERRCAFTNPRIFEKLGLQLDHYQIVVVKLGYLFPELTDVAARSILALTSGASVERIETVSMKKVRRPLYPFDKDFQPAWE